MNVFEYSQLAELNWKANLKTMTDFQPEYTFYSDFGIAEFCQFRMHDANAILDTFNRVIKSWSGSYKALTEIVLVLNHKSWAFVSNKGKAGVDAEFLGVTKEVGDQISQLYVELYEKAEEIFFQKYGKDENACSYYFEVTD